MRETEEKSTVYWKCFITIYEYASEFALALEHHFNPLTRLRLCQTQALPSSSAEDGLGSTGPSQSSISDSSVGVSKAEEELKTSSNVPETKDTRSAARGTTALGQRYWISLALFWNDSENSGNLKEIQLFDGDIVASSWRAWLTGFNWTHVAPWR